MKKYKNTFHKDIAKRIVSGLTAAVMLSSYLVFPEMPEALKFLATKFTTYAEDDGYTIESNNKYKIENRNGLVNYSKLYADDKATHSTDNIELAFSTGGTNENISGDFISFGDEDHPFKGSMTADSTSLNVLTLDKALFDYISDEATINFDNLTIRRYVDKADQALLANHVMHGNIYTANTWSVTIENVTDDNNPPATLVYDFAGIIGEMHAGSKLKLNVTDHLQEQNNGSSDPKFPQVSGEGDKGFICNTIQDNAELTVDMKTSSVCQVSSSNANAGGLVGAIGESATLTVNISDSDVTLSSVSGALNAGGIVGNMASGSTVTLNLSGHDFKCSSVNSESGNAGGIAGIMGSNATLNVNNSGSDTKKLDSTISGKNAGGLVGSAENCIINIGSHCQVSGTIKGDNSTGGIFGSYTNSTGDSINIAGYDISCTLKGKNAGGLFGVLTNNKSSLTFTDSKNSEGETETFKPKFEGTNSGSGSIIGLYQTNALTNSLIFDSVSVNPTLTSSAGIFGGLVGKLGETAPVYMQCTGNNKITVSSPQNTDAFGGILGDMGDKGSFLDVGGEVVISASGFKGGGIVCNANCGVIRLSGTTDLTNARAASGGQLVNTRGNTLIYSPGTGSDTTTWKFKRSSTAAEVDDIGTWGEVFRNSTNAAYSDVIDEGTGDNFYTKTHSVTVKSAVTAMSTTTDFIKTALNIQLNGGSDVGALLFEDKTTSESSTLLATNLALSDDDDSDDIDLSGTGITGLTRDNGDNSDFKGKFDGGGNTIKLAIGEAYGDYSYSGSGGSGRIYRHQYNGLFAKVSDSASVQNLTLNGNIYVSARDNNVYTGAVAAYSNGTGVSLTNVKIIKDSGDFIVTDNINQQAGTKTGGFIGYINDGKVDMTSCEANAAINATGHQENTMAGGICGHINNATLDLTNTTIKKSLTAQGSNISVGGITGQSSSATIKISGVKFSDYTLDLVSNSAAGALIGHKLDTTNITFEKIQLDQTELSGLLVENTAIKLQDASTKNRAGLACIATGYWKVNENGIDLESLTIDNGSGAAASVNSFGLLVNSGRISNDNCLYLELLRKDSYDIKSGVSIKLTTDCFDELVANNGFDNNDYVDTCENGRAIISIATGNTDDDIVNMESADCNTYQNRTKNGTADWSPNKNVRYYYNLDQYREDSTEDPEKLLIWSVKQYAGTNLKTYFKSDFSESITGNFDMKGYSYYPVDITDKTISNSNFNFYNDKIEANVNSATSSKKLSTKSGDSQSQHYLMHAGIFRNVTGGLTVTNATFSGTVGQAVKNGGSGVIVCGSIGSADEANAVEKKIKLDGITLNGISVNGGSSASYAPLLINEFGKYSTLTVNNVTAENYSASQTDSKFYAATSLIGNFGNSSATNMKVTFSNIVLDGRKTNNGISSDLNSRYGTSRSIFSKATLLNKFSYNASDTNSVGVYNFTYDEDWGVNSETNKIRHEVTYGAEIDKTSGAQYAGKQKKYYGSEKFTHPTNSSASTAYGSFKDNFIPYVAVSYSSSNSTYELKVNHSNANLIKGCGTYNDPYVIESGEQLEALAEALDNRITPNFQVNYPNNHTINKWCNEKTAHTTYTYDGSKFGNVSEKNMIEHLSHAYYSIEKDIDLGENTFNCIGGSNPFTGVIIGKKGNYDNNGTERYPIITNNTQKGGIISNSYGCVVKDVVIKLNKGVEYKSDLNVGKTFSTNESFSFGAVINQALGGDNIIDNVKVDFNGKTYKIKNKNNSRNLVPIGGYIGVVVDGGVYFRHMADENDVVYGGLNNSSDCLYQNPYIGRVINGFAVYETNHFGGSTLDNGEKNYIITDIKENESNKLALNVDTIEMPNAQSVFVLGAISQSGASKSNYNNDNYRVHHAQYDHVGETSQSDDYNLTCGTYGDKTGDSNKIPYIIQRYTATPSGFNNCNTVSYFFKLSTENGNYDLSNTGFRGINGLFNQDYIKVKGFDGYGNTINLKMSLKTYGKENNKEDNYKDNYHLKKQGYNSYGFFNYLYFDDTGIASPTNKTYSIHDLTLSGSVEYDENTKDYSRNFGSAVGGFAGRVNIYTDNKYLNLINIKTADGFTVKGIAHVGGLIGELDPHNTSHTTNNPRNLYIYNCSSDGITVNGCKSCGGILGYKPNNGNITIVGNNTTFKIREVKGEIINADGASYITNVDSPQEEAYGGLFGMLGYKGTGENIENCKVSNSLTISDLTICGTANSQGWIGSNTSYSEEVIEKDGEEVKGHLDSYSGKTHYTVISGAICGAWVTKKQISQISNFTYSNIKLVGGECGGIAGCAGRCTDGDVTTDNTKLTLENFNCSNIEILADVQAGGVIGMLRGKMGADLNGVTVNNLTMKKKNCQSGMDANFGALLGLVKNTGKFQMKNIKVENYNLTMCKEGHENIRVGSLMGGLMQTETGECKGYNILLKDISIIAAKNNSTNNNGSIGLYKVIGGKFQDQNPDFIQLVGVQIDNFNCKEYEGDKYYNGIDLETKIIEAEYPGLFKTNNQGQLLLDNKGNKQMGDATNSYIIYNDYNLTGHEEPNTLSPKIGNNSSILDGAYLGKEPNILANPSAGSGTNYFLLTGDGVGDKDKIQAILNDKVVVNGVEKNKYVNANGVYHRDFFREGGIYYGKVSTLKTQLGSSYAGADDFSVLVLDSTSPTTSDDLISGYLQILTNYPKAYKSSTVTREYSNASEDEPKELKYSYSKDFYTLTVTQYEFVGGEWQIAKTQASDSKGPTLQYKENSQDYKKSQFYMENGYTDSEANNPQFNLIDIAFYDPTNTNQIAYHLYVPVYVKKQIPFGTKFALHESSDYYSVDYNDKFGKSLVCNIGTPATVYVSFEYQYTLDDWQGLIDSGEDLTVDLGKSILFDIPFPNGTKYVLVDKEANGKTFYYEGDLNVSGNNEYKLKFSEFKDSVGDPAKTSSLLDLLVKQAKENENISLTATYVPSYSETNTDHRGKQLYILCNESNMSNATIRAKLSDNEWGYFTKAEGDPNGQDGYLITLSDKDSDKKSLVMKEEYFLTFILPSNDTSVYHIGLSSPKKFESTAIPTQWDQITTGEHESPHLIIGDFYEHNPSIKTKGTNANGSNYSVDSLHNKIIIEMNDTISIKPAAKKTLESYGSIFHVYQEFILQLKKSYKDKSGDVKKIGIVGNPSLKYTYSSPDLPGLQSESYCYTKSENLGEEKHELSLEHEKDLSSYLLSLDSIRIKCEVELTYTSNYTDQFPIREVKNDQNVGTFAIARSNIGTDPNTLSESTAQKKANEINGEYKSYYIDDSQSAKLTYNVPKESSSDIFGSYNQLGINAKLKDDAHTINGSATFSLEKITEASRNNGNYIRLYLSLYDKTNNSKTSPSYSELPLPIDMEENTDTSAYLKNVSIDIADDEKNLTLIEKGTYKPQIEGNKLICTFEIKKDNNGHTPEIFSFKTSFDVKTGNDLKDIRGKYSNYKVSLKAELINALDKESLITYADDYLIYTNAKLCKEILKTSSGNTQTQTP